MRTVILAVAGVIIVGAACERKPTAANLATVAQIDLSPASAAVRVGASEQITAVLKDADGNAVSGRTASWHSADSTIATISTTGMIRGVHSGSTSVVASADGASTTASVTVTDVPVGSVTVTPGTLSIATGASYQLAAATKDAAGNTLSGRTITWSSSNTAAATVSASGNVSAVAVGTATITATSEGQSGTSAVTVTAPPPTPVATVTVTLAASTITAGQSTQATAVLRDASGTVLSGRSITWGSSNTAVATVNASGSVSAVAAGTATITATSEGQNGSATLTVNAALAPVASVAVTLNASTLTVGQTTQATATLRDAGGNLLTGRVVTWASANTALATVSSSGLVTAVAAGTVAIRATSEGVTGSANLTVNTPAPAPVASVTVSGATSLTVGQTTQLTATPRDASNNVLTGRTVTWSSNNAAAATVSSSGVVTGVAAGSAVITATSEGVNGTLTVTVVAPPPSNGVTDPTLLVAATGQHPATATYGRTLAAGQTYNDPLTNVTVLKLTDASTPTANSGMYHGYSEGGPTISQPWTGTDGQTYYTAAVGTWLVDIKYATLQTTNWRHVSFWGELGLAFSLNPATPRIAYIGNSTRVDRYNTATNQVENIGNWPWVLNSAAGQYLDWLQVQLNDQWVVGMFDSNHTVVAFRPSDGVQRAITEADAGPIDEPHLDREFAYVYLSTNSTIQNKIVNLETGAYTNPTDPNGYSDDAHAAPLRGKVVAVSWKASGIIEVTNQGVLTVPIKPSPTDWSGDWHMAAQWVFNNPNEYFVVDQWKRADAYAIYQGMIGFVNLAGDVRLLAAHDAIGGDYGTGGQPHPTLAPDGKFVMWTSNMNGSGRYDTFIARVPVAP